METRDALDKALAELRFDAAANTIYHFVWDRFCDWYIELIKGNFDDETKAVAGWALDQILVMLHPFMPFITEELWSKQGDRANHPLITASWVDPQAEVDAEAKDEIELVIEAVRSIRSARAEMGVSPGTRMEGYVAGGSEKNRSILYRTMDLIGRLARVDWTDLPAEGLGQKNTLQVMVLDMTVALQLEGVIDIEAEKTRLSKALEASAKEAKSLEGRLSNANFVERAKPEAVEKARADHAHHMAEVARLEAALARLG